MVAVVGCRPSSIASRCVFVLGVLAAGCGDEVDGDQERTQGSGDVVTVARDVDAFDRIELAGEGEVRFAAGVDGRIEIETDDNIVGYIETTVDDGRLTISTERGVDIDPTDGVVYRVGCPAIVEATLSGAGLVDVTGCTTTDRLSLVLSGAGTVRAHDVGVSTLEVSLPGAGTISTTGSADRLDAVLAGAAELDAGDLRVTVADLDSTGVGAATVWVADRLDIELTGVGSVAYYGEPDVTSSITGIGSVDALGSKASNQ